MPLVIHPATIYAKVRSHSILTYTAAKNKFFCLMGTPIMSNFVNTKKSTGLRCISYTACLYSSSLRWKDS